jgi:hypothetical protein
LPARFETRGHELSTHLQGAEMMYIPCYCGCRMQGHRSNHDCFVSKRAADGRGTEWNRHAMTCPLAGDITGDVTLWTEQGRALFEIRNDIDREYSSRGPGTPTPLPSHRREDFEC